MMDRRLTAANARVADAALRGQVDAPRFVVGEPARVSVPVVDLRAQPDGARDRQLRLGLPVTVYEKHEGWAFVRCDEDGYVGYLPEAAIGASPTPTHRVCTPATHAYDGPKVQATDLMRLSFDSRVQVLTPGTDFSETNVGFIPTRHLRPIGDAFTDPVHVAEMFIGTPYLWGGNSSLGIDCSGLVQMGCVACGIPCPGDADLQENALGAPVPAGDALRRGDVVFWKGHVGWMVDTQTLLHANGHHMAVAAEPLADAIARIEANGDGPVTSCRRVL